jgi:hypothetical protein
VALVLVEQLIKVQLAIIQSFLLLPHLVVAVVAVTTEHISAQQQVVLVAVELQKLAVQELVLRAILAVILQLKVLLVEMELVPQVTMAAAVVDHQQLVQMPGLMAVMVVQERHLQ